MGFFRGSFLGFVCLLLFTSFLAMNLFWTLDRSLEYENVQSEISPLVNELTNSSADILGIDTGGINITQAAEGATKVMEKYCQTNTEYTFVFEGKTISVPCSTLDGGVESVVNQTANSLVYEIYYKEYNCSFFSCLTQDKFPFFLVSQKARDYWHQKFYFALIVSVILVILLFLLVESKANSPVITGVLLILASFPLLKIKSILLFFIPQQLHVLSLFLNIFFSKAYTVFWISSLVGLVLVGLGLGLKFSNAEFVKKMLEKVDKKPQQGQSKDESAVKKRTAKKK